MVAFTACRLYQCISYRVSAVGIVWMIPFSTKSERAINSYAIKMLAASFQYLACASAIPLTSVKVQGSFFAICNTGWLRFRISTTSFSYTHLITKTLFEKLFVFAFSFQQSLYIIFQFVSSSCLRPSINLTRTFPFLSTMQKIVYAKIESLISTRYFWIIKQITITRPVLKMSFFLLKKTPFMFVNF